MGLHVTPYGTFYVQRSLRTGEVMQVLPVRRPETPSHLPSVDSLGITDNFIERRRASIAATNARASHPQDSLQRELASAGGERLLETGKAVLAQRDDGDVEMNMGNGNGSGSGSGRGNEAGGTFSAPAAPGCDSSSSNSSSHHHRHHHQVNTDPHHPEMVLSPPPMATVPHVLPVRPWPEALPQREPVNLPSFCQIDSARALSQDGQYEHYEQHSHNQQQQQQRQHHHQHQRQHQQPCSGRHNPHHHHGVPYNHAGRSRSSSTSSHTNSASSMTSQDSASSTSTAVYFPLQDCHPSGSSSVGGANIDVAPAAPAGFRYQQQRHRTDRLPSHVATDRNHFPATTTANPASLRTTSTSKSRKNRTVWNIRTLQPRKRRPRRATGGESDDEDDDNDYDEPQKVETHVETHVNGDSDGE